MHSRFLPFPSAVLSFLPPVRTPASHTLKDLLRDETGTVHTRDSGSAKRHHSRRLRANRFQQVRADETTRPNDARDVTRDTCLSMVYRLCIASETKEEHRVHVTSVLTSLAQRHHSIKPSKMHILRLIIE